MSQITELASGAITAVDTITIELVETDRNGERRDRPLAS
jgi:hypothetical protein